MGGLNLGRLYQMGLGVAQDDKKASQWYKKAAEQDLPIAQYVVGVLYENGQGVAQDNKKAFEWYSKAAEQGYSDAAKALEELKNQ